ncbi:hypothetical protein [Rhodococcus spelaei]|nr:hypothetical protein [Rhodococcus spelaei]
MRSWRADLYGNGQDVTVRSYRSDHQVSLTQSLPDAIAFARAHI